IAGGGDGDGDGKDVIYEEGAAGDDAGAFAEELGGDHVSAAAVGKVLDDAAVGDGDNADGCRHDEGQQEGQVGVRAQRLEGFLGAVAGGGQAVSPEAYPGQEGDQGEMVEQTAVVEIAGTADEAAQDARGETRRLVGDDAGRVV